MNIDIRDNNIGIVIRGDFKNERLSPKWLLNKGVISEEEFISQSEDCIINQNELRYSIGTMNLVCDPTRVQIISTDISQSGRLSRMMSDILIASGEVGLRSVGINAGVLFTFTSIKDTIKFGRHFGMLDNLRSFMEEPRLRTVVFEDNLEANADKPRVTIKLASLENIVIELPKKDGTVEKQENVPLCTLEINNHFAIDNKEKAIELFKQAEQYHVEFREKYKQLFGGV